MGFQSFPNPAALRAPGAPAALAALAFPGFLFVLKYASRAGIPPAAAVPGYAGLLLLHGALAWFLASRLQRARRPRTLLFLALGAYAAALWAVYARIDPLALQIDRWSALERFWDAMFRGEYPYRAGSHLGSPISGFPGLFLLALPFYLLGDVGLAQFAALAAFALLSLRMFPGGGIPAFLVLLLAGLPVFVYELLVRSDLFANMTAAAWLLHLGRDRERSRGLRLLAFAAAWGVLLCTRGVVVIPLALAAFQLLHGRTFRDAAAFLAVAAAVCGALMAPFYFWDPGFFLERNPYFVQSGYIPGWGLALVLGITAALGYRHRAEPRLFAHSGFLLFGTVLGCLLLSGLQAGWGSLLRESAFDISYFSLPLPFLLPYLGGVLANASGPAGTANRGNA